MKCFFLSLILSIVFSGTALAADLPAADPAEFAGKTIGVLTGSMQEQWAATEFPESKLAYFSSSPDGVLALEAGKVDALFFSDVPLRYTIGERKDLEVLAAGAGTIPVAPIFGKNEKGDKLRAQFNEYLAGIKADGTLEKMEKKWVDGPEAVREFYDPTEPPNVNGKITVITQSGTAPFGYMKNGVMYGCEIELVREFCRKYGYQPVFYDANFDGAVMGVHTGKYDMGAAALMITEERAKSVNFGEPAFTCRGALLVKKGIFTGSSSADPGPVADGDDMTSGKQSIFQSIGDGFRRTFLEEDRWKLFASGMGVTLLISVLSVLSGTAAGFGLYLLCRNGNRIANGIVNAVNWFVTGMPLVVFLMVLFYVVFAKSGIDGTAVAIIGFSVVFALTTFHLMASGEAAVNIGQKEAAYSLGYSDLHAFLRIILPQAALHFLPPYQDEVVSLVKATAVVGYITVMDVTKIGDIVRGRTYDAIFPLLAVVIAYFLLSALCKAAVRQIIKKADTKRRLQNEIMKGTVIR